MKKALKAHIWEKDPDDYYVEPHWCNTRLFEAVLFRAHIILDPAAGSCRIPRAAAAAGYDARASDKVVRVPGVEQCNFLYEDPDCVAGTTFAIVSNPPFSVADHFVQRSLALAAEVAMLLPLSWMAGTARSKWLERTPLTDVLVLAPRPSMPPGKLIEAGVEPGGGKVNFAWFIWDARRAPGEKPVLGWLRRHG